MFKNKLNILKRFYGILGWLASKGYTNVKPFKFKAMIKKKNDKSNLENKRILFFELGAIVALSLLLVAFEWGTNEINSDIVCIDNSGTEIEELIVQRTEREPPKPKPPMMPIEFLVIKDVDIDIDDPEINFSVDIKSDGDVDYTQMADEPDAIDDFPHIIVENMPTYKGKDKAAFQKHLQELVKYPLEAQEADIQGKVFLQFVVNENGQITNEQIIKSPHLSLSEAVLAALRKTDNWKAGEQFGRKVKVSFTVPVFFRLN